MIHARCFSLAQRSGSERFARVDVQTCFYYVLSQFFDNATAFRHLRAVICYEKLLNINELRDKEHARS